MDQLIIRKAAGTCWLIKPEQKEVYIAPLEINESAAEIIRCLQSGKTIRETAAVLSEGDASLIPEIEFDIRALIDQVNKTFPGCLNAVSHK